MSKYTGIQKEETLKGLVFKDFFDGKKFGYEPDIDNIDFVITDPKTRGDLFAEEGSGAAVHYLWAESKKDTQDIYEMLTQLILTCKKTYEDPEKPTPNYIGCFDTVRIAFVDFHVILPVFTESDFNWNTTPSNHGSGDFQKAQTKVKQIIGAKIDVFNFGSDDDEIKYFIKNNLAARGVVGTKIPITKGNFVKIFYKWLADVKPTINIAKEKWVEYKKQGVLEGDFFRADMMSKDGNSITEKLKIILENDKYKFHLLFGDELFSKTIDFTDGGEAYNRFWNKYARPPAEEYQQYIIDRRDLLVPKNIRETKGSYFTPEIWVKKSQEYLEKVFGSNWQEEYYVWDCAAGTGNLLAGLTNPYNVWASDVDRCNVDTMLALVEIDEGVNLLPEHIFQFDFLNDGFDKLPEVLQKIISDPEIRKNLIVYINPPFVEVSSVGVNGKAGVNQSKIHDKYTPCLGTAGRELFAMFLARIYFEIPGCKIGEFSTIKILNGSAFITFREYFLAKLEKCFIVPAYTFDNVKGQFPIGFKIWNTEKKEKFLEISADIYDDNNNYLSSKTFTVCNKGQFINTWITSTKREAKTYIGFLAGTNGNDFQQNQIVYILNKREQMANPRGIEISEYNLIEVSIYFTARHCFEHTWINHNDQFLNPNDGYKSDTEFHNNCLIYTLFHGKNNIQSQYGNANCVNHWIPFTEKQVGAKEKFESAFMSGFLKDRAFSMEAQAVYNAGLELWKYYHEKTKINNTVSVNASLYDIKEFFQGRNDKGNMNPASTDECYNQKLDKLKDSLKTLTVKITPKIYEYGFLKE